MTPPAALASDHRPRRLRPDPALLLLEDGTQLRGAAFGARGARIGEVVFTTGMTGYQEVLTDPACAGQIVVQTSPHIGCTGANSSDMASRQVWARGCVVREASRIASSHRAEQTLDDLLIGDDVVGISDVDTRMLTRILRERGPLRGGIFSGAALEQSDEELLRRVREHRDAGADLLDEVTVAQPVVLEPQEEAFGTITVLDLGIRAATTRALLDRGWRVHLLPASTSGEELLRIRPDAVLLSDGPGDPAAAEHQVEVLRAVLDAGIPFLGIGLGHQLLGRALGFSTSALRTGHRGSNQPVKERSTGAVSITSQNHGFTVDMPLEGEPTAPYGDGRYGRVVVSHIGLNDGTVEGIRCLDLPARSVQHQPESASGPLAASHPFDDLKAVVTEQRTRKDV